MLPSLCQKLYTLLILALLVNMAVASAGATCYYPNGTAAIDSVWPYLPCNPNAEHSMCCRTTSTDTCRYDGLCDSGWDGNVWRDFCTDPTWQAPECIKLCLYSHGTDGDGKGLQWHSVQREISMLMGFLHIGNTGGSVRVTPCPDGSYCCGVGSFANNCCSTGAGIWIAKDGQTTSVKPSAAASRSSAAASLSHTPTKKTVAPATTTSTTSTKAPAAGPASQTASGPPAVVTQTVTKNSSSDTGAIAGGVVAGVVAAGIIIGAVIWALRRRWNRSMDQKHMGAPFAPKKLPLYGEMEGSDARQELPTRVGHEMAAEGPDAKQHRAAELP